MASRLTRQPQQALPLDRSNPLGAKVVEHISLRGGASSLLGAPVAYGAGGSTVAGVKGRSLRGAGASGRASVPLNLTKYSVITVAFWLYWDSYANNDALLMEFGPLYGANNGFLVDPNCSSPAAFMFGAGDGGNNNLMTFPRPSAGALHRILLTMDRAGAAGAAGTAYVDGVAQTISAFPGATPVTGNFGSDTLHLFSRNESSLLGTGNLQDLTIYRGALSAAEAAQDYQNPYQIFKARSNAYPTMLVAPAAASPDASVTLPSAAASSAAGTITASGGASATLPSAAASSAAGTIVASGSASVTIVGAAASAAAGTITASGAATVAITGAASSAQAGTIVASGAATAVMPSAAATAFAGTITVTAGGSASVTLPSAAAATAAGTMTASGAANAAMPSAAAATAAGTLAASGAANVTLPAAVAAALAGVLGGQGGASVSIVGVAGQLQAGAISAEGVFNGAAVAILVGAAAVASAGTITAVGTRVGIKVNITEDMICKVVRDYILSIAPSLRVRRTPVNKASAPEGAYVAFTPGLRMPLATNVSTYDDNGRFVQRSEQMGFQIDCYGEGAADLAETLNTLYRDKYAADLFAESGFDIAPLYAGNVMQAPFVNDSDQYEDRYTFEIELQVNSVIEVPQQSCNMLTIELESVDASYPPQEVE